MNRKRFFLVWAFIVLMGWTTTGAAGQSKDYHFPRVRIDIAVQRDGSFFVDEFRTFDFKGSFTWAKIWIPLKVRRKGYDYNVDIRDFKVLGEGERPLRIESTRTGGRFEAKWYYSAQNEVKTFHIHYKVIGGIISYPEVSEFYWQVIGDEWEKPTRDVTVNVYLPQSVSKEDILVYGHGPLSGYSEIVDGKTARFFVSNLHSGQYVEVRVAWPAGIVEGIPSQRHTYETIKKEEAQFVQETIERAQSARAEQEKNRKRFLKMVFFWLLSLVLIPLVWLFFYIRAWKKVGKDYRFSDIPEYIRELPGDLPPALVEVLLREGRDVTPRSFTATLFDLARRGYLEMEDRLVEKKKLFG
ncbi:MAG: DUF2207 domain-containing protein, partial [Candidatus Aminicenantes bacterium]|nr:DUF2207 domain-containing protein [Candidatus Aminicenantes bacterium]